MYEHVAREQKSEARVYGFDPVKARLVLVVGWLGGGEVWTPIITSLLLYVFIRNLAGIQIVYCSKLKLLIIGDDIIITSNSFFSPLIYYVS